MKKIGMEMKKYAVINQLNDIISDGKRINGKVTQVWFGIKAIEEVFDDDN